MAQIMEEKIADKLVEIITNMGDFKYVRFDEVKVATSDFQDHEIPAAQFWDVAQEIKHEKSRILVNWLLSLEIILRPLKNVAANQKELFKLRKRCQDALWDRV